jgi:ketosteroid isomerase-like protein
MSPNSPVFLKINALFSPLSQQGCQKEFIAHISESVHWEIPGHSPMSGTYTSRKHFVDSTLKVLAERVLTEPLRLRVVNVVGALNGDGDAMEGEAAVELQAIDAVCKNGLEYDMRYVWVCRFEGGKIVHVRAYLDTDLLTRAMKENMPELT